MKILKIYFPFILCFSLILFLSIYGTWMGDEIFYMFNFRNGEHINTLTDIIDSQNYHYLNVNGRYVAHTLVQFFNGYIGNQFLFSIINASIYIIFFIMIFYHAEIKISNSKVTCSTILILLFSFSTIYAPSCQIGYVWMYTLTLIYLYILFHKCPSRKIYLLFLVPLSIIAGNGNESLNIGISGALIIYSLKNFKHLTLNKCLMILFYGLGTLLLCISPGSLKRVAGNNSSIIGTVTHCIFLIIFTIFILYLLYAYFKFNFSLKIFYLKNSFYFNALITSLLFNLIIGIGTNRQIFGIELLSLILILKLYKIIGLPKSLKNYILIILSCAMIIKLFNNFTIMTRCNMIYSDFKQQYLANEEGTIYYDLSASDITSPITPCHLFHLACISSIGQLVNYENNINNKQIKVLPTFLKNKDIELPINSYFQNAPNSYIIISDKKSDIQITREIGFLPLNLNVTPKDLIYKSHNYNIYHIYQTLPFITKFKISFIQRNN